MIIHFSVWRKMAALVLRPLLITNLMPLFTLSRSGKRMSIMQLPKVILLSKCQSLTLFQMYGTWGDLGNRWKNISWFGNFCMILILVDLS